MTIRKKPKRDNLGDMRVWLERGRQATLPEIARDLDMSYSTCYATMQKLRIQGVAAKRGEAFSVCADGRLSPTPADLWGLAENAPEKRARAFQPTNEDARNVPIVQAAIAARCALALSFFGGRDHA